MSVDDRMGRDDKVAGEMESVRALVQIHREERDAEFAARRRAEVEVSRLREALLWISNVLATEAEYKRVAREALEAGER
jgi:hypothetical protein